MLQSLSLVWSPQWPCRTDSNLRDRLAKCHVFLSKRQFGVPTNSACPANRASDLSGIVLCDRSNIGKKSTRSTPRVGGLSTGAPHPPRNSRFRLDMDTSVQILCSNPASLRRTSRRWLEPPKLYSLSRGGAREGYRQTTSQNLRTKPGR